MKSITTAFCCALAVGALTSLCAQTQTDGTRPHAAGDGAGLRAKILARLDKDGDGQLSDAEKTAARAARAERRGEIRERVLAKFDVNHDGTLDDTERTAARAARHQRMLEKFDKNGDGVLSADERPARRALHRRLHSPAA